MKCAGSHPVALKMRETVMESEQSEPLLAERLYETYRQTERRQLDRSLQSARLSLGRGLLDDAMDEERIARQGIRQLREGVERAAESVLGDEATALRQALENVRELERQLQDEIARTTSERTDSAEQTPSERRDAASRDGSETPTEEQQARAGESQERPMAPVLPQGAGQQ